MKKNRSPVVEMTSQILDEIQEHKVLVCTSMENFMKFLQKLNVIYLNLRLLIVRILDKF